MAKFAPHMGDPHGDPQTSPQHADPHGLGAFLNNTIQEIHVDRRVVGCAKLSKHHPKHLLRLFLALKVIFISEVIFKSARNRPFKTNFKIRFKGYF